MPWQPTLHLLAELALTEATEVDDSKREFSPNSLATVLGHLPSILQQSPELKPNASITVLIIERLLIRFFLATHQKHCLHL